MTGELIGKSPGRAVLGVVGTWEPFLSQHRHFLEPMKRRAGELDLAPVVVLLDPPPAGFLCSGGQMEWPIYDDAETRIEFLLSMGIHTIVRIHFRREDLSKTCRDLFDVVCGLVELREFWRRPNQTMGQGSASGGMGILSECRRRGIRLLPAPSEDGTQIGKEVRRHLREGKLRDAIGFVGRSPSAVRPDGGILKRGWSPGWYWAVDAQNSDGKGWPMVFTKNSEGGASCSWPADAPDRLVFVHGPADVGAGSVPSRFPGSARR